MSTNIPTNIPTSISQSNDSLNKPKDSIFSFFKTIPGIITIIIVIFLILSGIAISSYFLAVNSRNKQTSTNTTTTNSPTSTSTPTQTNTATPTTSSSPIATVSPKATTPIIITTTAPIAVGKYSITRNSGSNPTTGSPFLYWDIKLNNVFVKTITADVTSCTELLPNPVTSIDSTKVYYVEPSTPALVKALDSSKNVTTVYTAPSPYKLVTAIAINPKGKLAYTITDKLPADCNGGYNAPKAAFVIDGKLIPQTLSFSGYVFEEIKGYGDTFITTQLELHNVGVGGGAQSIMIRKLSDLSLVKSFSSAGIIYIGSNYVLVSDGYAEMIPTGPGSAKQNLFKIDMSSGTITYILTNTLIRDTQIVGNKLTITYGGYIDATTFDFVGAPLTLVYSL